MPEPISLTTALILSGASTLAASGVSAGAGAASAAKKRKSDKKLGMKSMFSSSQPTGGGYSQGPNSIGSVIGAIAQAAGKVGKFAMENPELTKAALDTATNVGSQLIQNKQNKNKGAYMKGIDKSRKQVARKEKGGKLEARRAERQSERKEGGGKLREIGKKIVERKEARRAERQSELQNKGQSAPTPEAPSMMGYNPISKHMGGRGADMMGKKPMMMGENVIVRDSKSGGKNQYDKYGK